MAGAFGRHSVLQLGKQIAGMTGAREPYGQRQALAVACHQRIRFLAPSQRPQVLISVDTLSSG